MMFNLMFVFTSLLTVLCFVSVFGILISRIVKGAKQSREDDRSPVLTVEAEIVAKRMEVYRRHSSHHSYHSAGTRYYVTFQVESGDRMELHVAGHEFGMLIEGDRGMLTFQGTRYLGFERKLDTYDSERYQDQ